MDAGIHQLLMKSRGPTGQLLPVIERESTDRLATAVADGSGPAGSEPLRQDQVLEIRPQRIMCNIVHQHRRVAPGRRSAGAHIRPYGHPV